MIRDIFTNNTLAKLGALALAVLLWAVIKRGQTGSPGTPPAQPSTVEFGASAYGK